MYYAIVGYPQQSDFVQVNRFRQIYDPQYNLIAPHITLVFPFMSEIDIETLNQHIKKSISNMKSFPISTNGPKLFTDNVLYLPIEVGRDKLIKLHDLLYAGILSSFKREDINYFPHITIGFMGKADSNALDEEKYKSAIKQLREIKTTITSLINTIALVAVDNQKKQLTEIKRFTL